MKNKLYALCLVLPLLVAGCGKFNSYGLLTKEPSRSELIAEYRLDPGWVSDLSKMGYKDFSGSITLRSDSTFVASNIPACCLHHQDEANEPFSGGYYAFSGRWKLQKLQAVYVVLCSITDIHGREVPGEAELQQFRLDRVPSKSVELRIMKGNPLSVGFALFRSGDFTEIEFSRR